LLTHVPSTFIDQPIQGYLATKSIPDNCTPIPLAMPEAYHTDDAIQSYRLYYIKDKQSIAMASENWQQLSSEWNIQP